MKTQSTSNLIGQTVIYTAQTIPALVTVLAVRQVWGRTDYQVRDCVGGISWVAESSLRELNSSAQVRGGPHRDLQGTLGGISETV